MPVQINQGTQTGVATDLVGTVHYQIIKLDVGTAGGTALLGTANPLPSNLNTLIAGEDLSNVILGVMLKPVNSITYAPTEYTNFGTVTAAVVKNGAGNIYSAYVTNGTNAIRYFQIFNGTSTPALGGTAAASYRMGSVPAGGVYELNLTSSHFAPSRFMGTGIAWAISSTDGTLGTASVTAADHSVHIKYV